MNKRTYIPNRTRLCVTRPSPVLSHSVYIPPSIYHVLTYVILFLFYFILIIIFSHPASRHSSTPSSNPPSRLFVPGTECLPRPRRNRENGRVQIAEKTREQGRQSRGGRARHSCSVRVLPPRPPPRTTDSEAYRKVGARNIVNGVPVHGKGANRRSNERIGQSLRELGGGRRYRARREGESGKGDGNAWPTRKGKGLIVAGGVPVHRIGPRIRASDLKHGEEQGPRRSMRLRRGQPTGMEMPGEYRTRKMLPKVAHTKRLISLFTNESTKLITESNERVTSSGPSWGDEVLHEVPVHGKDVPVALGVALCLAVASLHRGSLSDSIRPVLDETAWKGTGHKVSPGRARRPKHQHHSTPSRVHVWTQNELRVTQCTQRFDLVKKQSLDGQVACQGTQCLQGVEPQIFSGAQYGRDGYIADATDCEVEPRAVHSGKVGSIVAAARETLIRYRVGCSEETVAEGVGDEPCVVKDRRFHPTERDRWHRSHTSPTFLLALRHRGGWDSEHLWLNLESCSWRVVPGRQRRSTPIAPATTCFASNLWPELGAENSLIRYNAPNRGWPISGTRAHIMAAIRNPRDLKQDDDVRMAQVDIALPRDRLLLPRRADGRPMAMATWGNGNRLDSVSHRRELQLAYIRRFKWETEASLRQMVVVQTWRHQHKWHTDSARGQNPAPFLKCTVQVDLNERMHADSIRPGDPHQKGVLHDIIDHGEQYRTEVIRIVYRALLLRAGKNGVQLPTMVGAPPPEGEQKLQITVNITGGEELIVLESGSDDSGEDEVRVDTAVQEAGQKMHTAMQEYRLAVEFQRQAHREIYLARHKRLRGGESEDEVRDAGS